MIYWIILLAVFIFGVLPFILLDRFSAKQFNRRMDNPYRLEPKDFGLEYQEIYFKNLDGKNLKGYKYYKKGGEPKALILLTPGFKNNHNHYLPEIEYFASRGYLVFAFDSTAVGRSEGDRVKGLLQIPLDACAALEHIKQDAELNRYPLLLWGYSNGAYATLCLINDQKVAAAASLSAFNDLNMMTADYAVSNFGKIAKLLYPYCVVYNRLKYGKNPFGKAVDNVKKIDKPLFLAHGAADEVVPYKNFLRIKKYNAHPLSVNISIDDRGHWIRYTARVNNLRNKLREKLDNAPLERKADLRKYYYFVARNIDFELVEKTADFFDNVIQNIIAYRA